MSEVRTLIGVATNTFLATVREANGMTIFSTLGGLGAPTAVSAHVPDAASDVQQAIQTRRGTDLVVPIWSGVTMIRDVYTGAAKAEVAMTAHFLGNLKLLRTGNCASRRSSWRDSGHLSGREGGRLEEKMDIEYRYCEIRSEPTERAIRGTVVRYGDRASIAGVFTEEVRAGALTILDGVILNHQHDRSKPLVRLGDGLEIRDDSASCSFRAALPNTPSPTPPSSWSRPDFFAGEHRNARSARVLVRDRVPPPDSLADLVGLALVDRPAYPASSVSLRATVRYRRTTSLLY